MRTETLPGGWQLFWLLAGLVVMLSGFILAIHPDTVEAVHLVIRVTAYTSFVPFLAAFVASSAVTLAPNAFTRRLLRERRYLGLASAFSFLMHLIAIVAYGAIEPPFWTGRSALVNLPGTIGYVFIALMAATSFHFISRHMSATAWKRLHTAGAWVIATIYALSFLPRMATTSVLYAIPFSALCVAIAVRAMGKRAQDRKHTHPGRSFQPEKGTPAPPRSASTSSWMIPCENSG